MFARELSSYLILWDGAEDEAATAQTRNQSGTRSRPTKRSRWRSAVGAVRTRGAKFRAAVARFFRVFNGDYARNDGKLVHYCEGLSCPVCGGCQKKLKEEMVAAMNALPVAKPPMAPSSSKWTKTPKSNDNFLLYYLYGFFRGLLQALLFVNTTFFDLGCNVVQISNNNCE